MSPPLHHRRAAPSTRQPRQFPPPHHQPRRSSAPPNATTLKTHQHRPASFGAFLVFIGWPFFGLLIEVSRLVSQAAPPPYTATHATRATRPHPNLRLGNWPQPTARPTARQVFGLLNLFGNMFPFLWAMLKRMPFVSSLLSGKNDKEPEGFGFE